MAIGLDNTGFSDALVILGAAGIVIPAFARFKISPVIGFILVGMLVGPAGLGALVGRYPWLYHVTIIRSARDRAVRRVRHHPAAVLDRARTVAEAVVGHAPRRVRGRRSGIVGVRRGDRQRAVDVRQQLVGGARPRPGARTVVDRTGAADRRDRNARSGAARSRCCCSKIWRWCRSSSCSRRWAAARRAGC